jgi:imidazolonepropionase-like amidohydrolase
MHKLKCSFLLLLLTCILGCGSSGNKAESYDIVLKGVNVVDVNLGEVIENQLVAIRADTIRLIQDAAEPFEYRADTLIEAAGKWVIPALWDMHVHFRGGEELTAENKALLPLYIAHGVTVVRDAGGDLTPAILEWREELAEDSLLAPRIYTSGPKLDGPEPTWGGSIELESPAAVSAAIDSLEALGVDYIKIYDSSISREVFLAIIREAEKRGIKTTAHMPFTATLGEAVDAGLDATEHMYYVMKASAAKEDSLTRYVRAQQEAGNPVGFYTQLEWYLDRYDSAAAGHIFNKMADANTAVVPTLHIGELLANLHGEDHQQDSLLPYIGSGIQETYQGRLNSAKKSTAKVREIRKRFGERFRAMVPEMQKRGVMILAGSDAGPYNSFVYPGLALHKELEELVEAGLTPAEALKASTYNGASFFGVEAFYGTVEEGKSAELLLLNGNPLENISNTQNIFALLYQSRLHNSQKLKAVLESVRQ